MPLVSQLSSVPWIQIVGAVVAVATGVHTAALLVGQFWAPALKVAAFTGAIALDAQKVAGWIGGAPIYTSIAAKKAGKAMIDDAGAKKSARVHMSGLVFLVALFDLPACSPSQLQQAATIADDVGKIATVLCLADHARPMHARAMTVADACKTIEQLAPYLAEAKGAPPRAACAP